MAPACLASDDKSGCTQGVSADRRRAGLCPKHYARFLAHGSALAVHQRGRKAPGVTGLVAIEQPPVKPPLWRRIIHWRNHGR